MTGCFKRLITGLVAMMVALPVVAQTQMEMNAQAAQEFDTADKRLNEVYRILLAKMPSDHVAKLREAQLTWLRFRDQECVFEAMGFEGGSMHPMQVWSCKAALTSQRVRDLEKELNCGMGHVSC